MISKQAQSFLQQLVSLGEGGVDAIVVGRVVVSEDYRVKIEYQGQVTDWLYQFSPVAAQLEDVVVGIIQGHIPLYFGVMQPSVLSETADETTYTTPRIASDIWDLNNPPVPW